MRKIFLTVILLSLFIVSCDNGGGYVIKADIDRADGLVFDLSVVENNDLVVIDSAIAQDGRFTMKGSVDYPRQVFLIARNTDYSTTFYLDNSRVDIVGLLDSLDAIEITGSVIHAEYERLSEEIRPLSDDYGRIVNEYQIARQLEDAAGMALLEQEADDVYQRINDLQIDYVRENPSSSFAPTVLSGISTILEVDELEELAGNLSPEVAANPIIVGLKESIIKQKTVSIGQKAPDFTLNDPDGNPVSLYSKIGSGLLLVDFWAGWCAPCRQENPNVVNVYNEFNELGFDVFGVSLDRTQEEWENAIRDDKLEWTHVSDLLYWQSEVAGLYMVNSIPANFLLDENGIIIARNLRGDDLYDTVEGILR